MISIIDQRRKIQTPLCIHRVLIGVFPDVRLRAKSGLVISSNSKYESHMRVFADVVKIVVGRGRGRGR